MLCSGQRGRKNHTPSRRRAVCERLARNALIQYLPRIALDLVESTVSSIKSKLHWLHFILLWHLINTMDFRSIWRYNTVIKRWAFRLLFASDSGVLVAFALFAEWTAWCRRSTVGSAGRKSIKLQMNVSIFDPCYQHTCHLQLKHILYDWCRNW